MKKEEKIIELTERVMNQFQKNCRNSIKIQQLRTLFDGQEWNNYRQDVIKYIIETKNWVTTSDSGVIFNLTEEGNHYLDNC